MGLLGYSDNNILIAPTWASLQGMLQVCEAGAAKHNLTFSTDPNPQKCKTKCLKFEKKIEEV